jgi:hypothetical protein
VTFTTLSLRQKLEKWGLTELTLSSNISVNSKLFAKTLKGVKQWPRGRCLTKKNRGKKFRETVSLKGPSHYISWYFLA